MRYNRDAILDATDLPALADEELGGRRGIGPSAKWRCPSLDHQQTGRTPPLSIFTGNAGQRWRCHGCGAGGTAIDLLMVSRGITPRDALELLAGRAGISPSAEWTTPPSRPKRMPEPFQLPALSEPEGLRDYIEACAERLWRPPGRPVREWLTNTRRIPAELLRQNRVGADPGARLQVRPDGVPRIFDPAVVFPVTDGDQFVFAQLRRIRPRENYSTHLNLASRLAHNPKVCLYYPLAPVNDVVVVTEGFTDALSACAAGFVSAPVFGATSAREEVAARLAALDCELVTAFDPDQAGNTNAPVLDELLRARGRRSGRIPSEAMPGDLNEWMCRSDDWPGVLREAIAAARVSVPRPALDAAVGL
jgi:hypothetical protein